MATMRLTHHKDRSGGGHGGEASWRAAGPARGWPRRAIAHRAWLVGDHRGSERVRDRVEVRCYGGGRGDETPQAVLVGVPSVRR